MIPSAFVTLDAFPLTPNGKVDRRALPRAEGLHADFQATYVAPRNDIERTIAAIWQEVLNLDQVGIHDNFFELGGHSLLATQVTSLIRNQLGFDLRLQTFFESSTISDLATKIEELMITTIENLSEDEALLLTKNIG